MNARDVTRFQEMLVERQNDLIRIISDHRLELNRILQPDESGARIDFNHPADMVSGESDYEKELSLLEQERRELAQVEAALERIYEGIYGNCEECGLEIPYERLMALPYAQHCIECQMEIERDLPRATG